MAAGTLPTQTPQASPPGRLRRITEDDARYKRLHARTLSRLRGSIAELVRELLKTHPEDETAVVRLFLARHTRILREAYGGGWREGAHDYWQAVSLRRHQAGEPDRDSADRALRFYTPSLAKMAHEARQAYGQPSQQRPVKLDEGDLADWQGSLNSRLVLQAEIVWSGLNDGYVETRAGDPAAPWAHLYWDLGAVKTMHCTDCPSVAAGSPYDAPGYGPRVLRQTPGDGRTRCGAGCKCSLRYGPGVGGTGGAQAVYPAPHPIEEEPELAGVSAGNRYTWGEVDVLAPWATSLTDEQRGALDDFRSARHAWERERGELPNLPDLFSVTETGTLDQWFAILDRMTPQQRRIYEQVLDAISGWNAATEEANTALFSREGSQGEQLGEGDDGAMRFGFGGFSGFRPSGAHGGHSRGYHGQGHGWHGYWLPGHGSLRQGEHEAQAHAIQMHVAAEHGQGGKPGGGHLAQRESQERMLAHRKSHLAEVEAHLRKYDHFLAEHPASHPQYEAAASHRVRLHTIHEALREEIGAREHALGIPVERRTQIAPFGEAPQPLSPKAETKPESVAKAEKPPKQSWRELPAPEPKAPKGRPRTNAEETEQQRQRRERNTELHQRIYRPLKKAKADLAKGVISRAEYDETVARLKAEQQKIRAIASVGKSVGGRRRAAAAKATRDAMSPAEYEAWVARQREHGRRGAAKQQQAKTQG